MKDRNVLKGLFLIAIALAFGLGSLKYPVGKLERAGPGFFPLLVSSILFLLGLSMVIRSRFMETRADGVQREEHRDHHDEPRRLRAASRSTST